ncbi:MAG: 2-oxo acid dehydrogenase subunit E2, partial [Amylibacter sp.]|nr:2-oxo acid dehydrogenase subunit E2 [Amylibacter sp.]
NVVWAQDRILQMKSSDVAVAVSVEGGLYTPVIFNSEKKTLSSLSLEIKDLASRAREKKLSPNEYQGGSFAISNLGMMGVENFDAVINPPHGSILAVGAGTKKPIVKEDGTVSVSTMMSLTLSVDHRAIDGALGAEFLAQITNYLENPLSMLV